MVYKIVFTRDTQKQFQQLPGHIKSIVRKLIAGLSSDPRPPQAKQLAGHPDYYRIWIVGTYRVVWLVNDEESWLEMQYIGPKTPDLYATLGLGRPDINIDSE